MWAQRCGNKPTTFWLYRNTDKIKLYRNTDQILTSHKVK